MPNYGPGIDPTGPGIDTSTGVDTSTLFDPTARSGEQLTLLDGSTAYKSDVTFDPTSYYWSAAYSDGSTRDITDLLTRAQKISLSSQFDPYVDNARLSDQHLKRTIPAGEPANRDYSTSTLGIFTNDVTSHPLQAPLESLNRQLGRPLDKAKDTAHSLLAVSIIGAALTLLILLKGK